MANYEPLFNEVLKKEGGYQNQAADKGNWCGGSLVGTKYGVAATGYKAVMGKCPTQSEMKNLTLSQAKYIWKKLVWDKIRGDQIKSQGVAAMILDAAGGGKSGYLHTRIAINKVAGKKIVNEVSTMQLSDEEVSKLNSLNQKQFFAVFNEIRKNYFLAHPQYAIYGKGWLNRLRQTFDKYIGEVGKYAPMGLGAIFFLVIGYIIYNQFKNNIKQ